MLWRLGHSYWRSPTRSPALHLVLDIPFACIKSRTFLLHSQWRSAAALKVATIQSSSTSVEVGLAHTGTRREAPQGVALGALENGNGRGKGESLVLAKPVTPDYTADPPENWLALIDALASPSVSKEEALERLDRFASEEGRCEYMICLSNRWHTARLALRLAESSQAERSVKLLRVCHKLGMRMKFRTYEDIAHRLANREHWSLIPSVAALARLHSGRSSAVLLNWRARAYIEMRHYVLLGDTLEEFRRHDIKPNRRTFHLLITGHIRNRDLGKARYYLQKMEEAGYVVDASTYAAVVSVYRSLGPDPVVCDQALEALQNVSARAATRILNSLMQFAIDAGDVHGVARVMSLFDQESSGVQSIIGDGGDFVPPIGECDPQTVGTSMSPSPDVSTLHRLISFMSKERDLPSVLQIFYRMQDAGIVPDSSIAAALVRAHLRVGNEATAVQIVADMCPPTVPLGLLVRIGFISGAPYPRRTPVIQSPLTVGVLNALLKGIIGPRGLNGLNCILQIMQIVGIKPDENTIKILLHYLDSTELARPRDIIRILRKLTFMTSSPTLKHVHKVLKGILRREKIRARGQDLLRSSVVTGASTPQRGPSQVSQKLTVSGDVADPTAGLAFPRVPNLRSLMRPVIRSLTSHGVRNDAAMYALRIRSDAVKGNTTRADEVLKEMISRGIHPNEYHFSALMTAYVTAGNLPAAHAVMRNAARSGVTPNAVMYTILLSGYARVRNPTMALHTFEEMIQAGITPDAPAIDTLVTAFLAARDFRSAKRLLLHLWSLVMPLPREQWHDSLKSLVKEFRSASLSRQRSWKDLSGQRGKMLRWKMSRVLRRWWHAAA